MVEQFDLTDLTRETAIAKLAMKYPNGSFSTYSTEVLFALVSEIRFACAIKVPDWRLDNDHTSVLVETSESEWTRG